MKRCVCFVFAAAAVCRLLLCPVFAVDTLRDEDISISAPAAVLMERSTGEILYEKNAREHYAPASVTKVMTMLLVAEAIAAGELSRDDIVTASANAAGMGGSQIWLEEGERMSVDEMLKCVTVVSANDCCVALAEHLAGTEEAFVARMNRRAEELGMEDTHFVSCSGLTDSDEHYTCARDIAVMSRELLGHQMIKDYTTIWMDEIRDGKFGLSNTNKLIYYYSGATGLKTGFTRKAMYCLSASAEREGVEYIAVVLHAQTSAERFDSAKTLLNYAFANYSLVSPAGQVALPPVKVRLGERRYLQPELGPEAVFLTEKNRQAKLQFEISLPESVNAPVEAGQSLGSLTVLENGTVLRELPLCSVEKVGKKTVLQIFVETLFSLTEDRKDL